MTQEASTILLSEAIRSTDAVTLIKAVADPAFTEDLALALLKRSDLPPEALQELNKSAILMKSRKVKLGLVGHPKTPNHISLPIVRQLYTFDLVRVALTPVVPAHIKAVAEEVLVSRLEKLSSGEGSPWRAARPAKLLQSCYSIPSRA